MNIGNPNDWENPCNRCNYNISDYDIGYNKAIDDFTEWLVNHKIVDKDSMPEIIMDFNEEQLKAGGRE